MLIVMGRYGTAVEHHTLYQYQFANTQNIFMAQIQTETPSVSHSGRPPPSVMLTRTTATTNPTPAPTSPSLPYPASTTPPSRAQTTHGAYESSTPSVFSSTVPACTPFSTITVLVRFVPLCPSPSPFDTTNRPRSMLPAQRRRKLPSRHLQHRRPQRRDRV